jgi:glutamate synthase (ferredoxin)
MSGGIAYILDEKRTFPGRCNLQMVGLETIGDPEEAEEVRRMIERHARWTGSARAQAVLERWGEMLPRFVKVLPKDYKRMLESMKRVREAGLSGEEAIMAAFEENAQDVARIGGS